jgi:hypothetical protein
MTPTTNGHSVNAQLRALNNEHRNTLEALNHAQASLNRAIRLSQENYQANASRSSTRIARSHAVTMRRS